jgi:hypothetical protein
MTQDQSFGGEGEVDEINAIFKDKRNRNIGVRIWVMDERAVIVASDLQFIRDLIKVDKKAGADIEYKEGKLPNGQDFKGAIQRFSGKKRSEITHDLEVKLRVQAKKGGK